MNKKEPTKYQSSVHPVTISNPNHLFPVRQLTSPFCGIFDRSLELMGFPSTGINNKMRYPKNLNLTKGHSKEKDEILPLALGAGLWAPPLELLES